MPKKTVKNIELNNKKVIVREDYNVPLDNKGKIIDYTRIDESLPTLNYLIKNKASVIIISHLGRPNGKDKNFSLYAIANYLSRKINKKVKFIDDCLGTKVKEEISKIKPGEVILLENLRFYSEEEENDIKFAEELSKYGDIFVCDAFGALHREHASVHMLPKLMKKLGKNSVAGFLVEKELFYLDKSIKNPERPFLVILGGNKISTKINVINNLLEKVDKLIIGGGMANTFLKSQNINIGKSKVEYDKIDFACEMLKKSKEKGIEVILPTSLVVTDPETRKIIKIVDKGNIPENMENADIGPETIKNFSKEIKKTKTIFWNGPLGIYEIENFSKGTIKIAKLIASLNNKTSIIGGGDSVAAISKAKVKNKINHISTGGGAFLDLIGGKNLPGLEELEDM